MKIKDISKFRTWYKELIPARKKHPEDWNEHFMGVQHGDESGFLQMYHGDKPDIYGFLRKEVEMAEDGQAIYEFVQNAADSDSTHFYMLYDENYFLAINNGEVFSKEGLKSILNIGQSFGKTDPDKIGRYGIGFKLVHRLVGKSQGLDELLNTDGKGYRGPIMFSWSQYEQLQNLCKSSDFEYGDFEDDQYPWLLKIIMTNFPSSPGETVFDKEHVPATVFPYSEFEELRQFLSESFHLLDSTVLNSGTLFLIKLGEGKFEYLERQKSEHLEGLTTSMHFLRHINTIRVNDAVIIRDENATNLLALQIDNSTQDFIEIGLTEKRDLESDVRFEICFSDNYESATAIKLHPNIYKYFPAVKEVNNLSLIIHCNVFELSSNRQNLTETPINKMLLSKLSGLMKEKMNELDAETYKNLFLSILVSDGSASTAGSGWQNEYFYNRLNNYIKDNIPTAEGDNLPNGEVLIKGTKLKINPADFGIEKQWFYWDEEDEKELVKEAKKNEKLGLKKWDIATLIENSDVDKVNEWLSQFENEEREIFISELDKSIPKTNFFDINFLECTDGCIYSVNDVAQSNSAICLFNNIDGVADILNKIGLVTTKINLSQFENIKTKASEKIGYLNTISENKVFEKYIKPSTSTNSLTVSEKIKLFLTAKELRLVGAEALKDWKLFSNSKDEIVPLGKLITSAIKVEPWLSIYQLRNEEYFKELDEYLIQLKNIFPSIIHPNWDKIIDNFKTEENAIVSFYASILNYFDNELHRGKSLTDKRYIYCGNEFLESKDVFYHEAFNSVNNFQSLADAIKEATGFETPNRIILKYLSNSPFTTKNDQLLDHLTETELTIEEVYELLRFCQNAEIKIFSKASFSENDEGISITLDDGMVQYHSTDEKLIEFIEGHLSDSFKLLPAYLDDFKTFEGVLRNQELYEKIITEVDDIYELAEEFLPLLKHKEVVKKYIKGIEDIRLNSEDGLTRESYEYLIVSNIVTHFEEDEFEEIRDNFVIETDDLEFKLSQITSKNEVQFDIDNKIYTLKVSEILPESDNFSMSEALESLLEKLKRLELPKAKLENLFSIEIEEDDLVEKIANDLKETIEDNIFTNAEQVAFGLLYELKNGWSNFKNFNIQALNGDTYSLDDVWYVSNNSFLKEGAVIQEKHESLAKILKLKDGHPVFKVSNDCIFLFKPTFDEEGEFLCKYLDENLDDEICIDFFDFLFNEYNKRGKDSKRDFEAISDWSNLGETETKKIIGFDPKNTILFKDFDYQLDAEKAPEWLVEWADTGDKKAFLRVLGIHLDDSDIIKLRKSLFDKPIISANEIQSSVTLNDQLLENTLDCLCDGELIEDFEKVELLIAVIEKLGWNEDDYWSIDFDKLGESGEEWKDDTYENWRDDDDSFEVRIFSGPMPWKFEYNEYIIATKGSGDYWFDEENSIFYCNREKSTLLLLQLAAEEGILDSDSIKALTNQGLARIKELEEENQRLRSISKGIMKFDVYEENIPTSDDLLDNTDERTRISVNEEAQQRIFTILKSKGYVISSSITINFTIVDGIKHPDGQIIKVVTKSAKGGTIYFNPSEWLVLAEEYSQLFVVLSGNIVFNVTIDDLISNNDRFHLRFNTQAFVVQANLKVFAELIRYLPETHFLFKAPINTVDFFKEFGLSDRNPSSSELTADDINLLV